MVDQQMLPCCSKDVKFTDDSETEHKDDSIKTEPSEMTTITENEGNQATNHYNYESEEDDDLFSFEPGDKIITISRPWSHSNQDELSENEEEENENNPNGEIKTERYDESTKRSIGVNTERTQTNENKLFITEEDATDDEVPEAKMKTTHTCILCYEEFISKITLYTHLQRDHKEAKKCRNCKVQYDSFKELEEHEPYCPRAYGIIHARTSPPTPRRQPEPRRPYKCRLCHRRYTTYANLVDHLIKRCKKRYISGAWVVKY